MTQPVVRAYTFADLVTIFASWHGEYASPSGAAGACDEACRNFMEMCADYNLLCAVRQFFRPKDAVHASWPSFDNHYAIVRHDYMTVDFTARQFWPNTPYPLIEDSVVYAARFARYTEGWI